MRLAKALIGVAEANALAAESIAIERGVGPQQIAQTEALALHAAAFNGMPDPVFHLTARAMAIVTGLAAVEPDPRAPDTDVLLDAALQAATGLAHQGARLSSRRSHLRGHGGGAPQGASYMSEVTNHLFDTIDRQHAGESASTRRTLVKTTAGDSDGDIRRGDLQPAQTPDAFVPRG